MARKESEGSFDDDSSFHEDPIPGLITGHDDNCYEINLVTAGGRTIAKRDDDDDDGEEDEDGEEDCVNFSTCDLLDMSSLWDELEALGVRTADIDEFMCRFGACESSDSGVESDCYVACYGDDDGGLPERKELYEALKRGRLVMVGKNNNNNNNNGKDPSLLAFIEAKVRRIRAWRASLRKVDDVGTPDSGIGDGIFVSAEEKALDDVGTPDSGIGDGIFVSAEEKARQHEEWKQELIKTEEEIQTLRQVLNAKLRHAADLKRKLGITAWKEFADDMNKGIVSVKESQAVMGAKEKIGGVIDTEEEIQTLRQVLNAKLRHAADLKRKLGITAWKEFADDMNKGIVSVKESQAVMGAKEKIGGVIDVINQSQL
ncbi:unnamed protein product [Notodromas monacha]|uniref:Uncharacterized protein n=1 Tax=Notodromas monacha TaxID=399045 RepID=A0A7R9GID6_9CRUS|nr:unnamed protein product [Notodromas monacha]CAG0922489.1 unnamed protein product [Notodromas monacha]